MMADLTLYPYPGKFEGEPLIVPLLFDLGTDEDVSLSEHAVDWYGLIRGPLSPEEIDDAVEGAEHELSEADWEFLLTFAGAILHENDQGFVSADLFDAGQNAALDAAWNEITDELDTEED